MKKEITSQVSWVGGQVNKAAWRRDDVAALKTGSERQENARVEATEQVVPRPGRRLFCKVAGVRTEYLRVAGIGFLISFSTNSIQIVNATSGVVAATFTNARLAWTSGTLDAISWCLAVTQVVICFTGMRPQLAGYDPIANVWGFNEFGFRVLLNAVQEPFFRFKIDGSTMSYSTYSGAGIALTSSVPYFTNDMVGTNISIIGQQAQITAVADAQHATVTAGYVLPASVACLVDNCTPYLAGQIASFKVQGVKIEVSAVQVGVGAPSPGGTITGVLLSSALYPGATTTVGEQLISPLGFAAVTFGPNQSGIASTVQWQEEFMSARTGWPRACAFDRRRLIFYDFPQKQDAIVWGSIDGIDMFWIDSAAAALSPQAGTEPQNAFMEFVGDNEGAPRVRHVAGWADEFVFTDRGIYQIPISATNPLKPGSVEFRKISNDGVSELRPIDTTDALVYMNAGLKRASAVKAAPLATSARPFITDDVSEPHSDLFTGPIVMAVTTGDGAKPERYIYVLNQDGSLIVGKFTADRQFVGWAPWTSALPPAWISAAGATVYYTVDHGAAGIWVETEDLSLYLDSAAFPNALPASVSANQPLGQGPLWFLAGQTVVLMDGLKDKGDYAVDALGNIVPNDAGEDLTSPTLIAGRSFAMTLIPLVPMAGAGESVGQRQHRRKVSKFQVTFQQSSGFKIGKRAVPAYKFGDDQSQPPVLRDDSEFIRPLGRDFDPSNAIVKDRPGPLRIVEISQEVTV